MTAMIDETPETARDRVSRCGTALAKAELELKRARDAEVDARHTFEAARRRTMLSDDCPKVTRGGVTTAERDAWVEEQSSSAELLFQIAEVRRQAAKDHYETVNTQAMLAMAILRSIDTAFNVAGRSQP